MCLDVENRGDELSVSGQPIRGTPNDFGTCPPFLLPLDLALNEGIEGRWMILC